MNKNVIIVGIILFGLLGCAPLTIGNSNSNENYNLKADIEPMRYAFPRVYGGNGQPVGFIAWAINEGPNSSPACILKFEIIRILTNDPYEYNATYEINSQPSGQGVGHSFIWCTAIGKHFAVYEARATINVDDNNTADNTKSYFFITIRK